MIDPHLLAVARGDAPADLLMKGGRVMNVFTREVESADVAIVGERVAGVGDYDAAERVVELRGAFIAPGFIDAHMHVESTMLPPSQFVRLAVPHGTTGVVLDPHEIANVLGIEGIRWIMADAEGLPINAMFAASSCVPSSHLETSGATLTAADLAPLFADPRVVALAEMMNYPGVVAGMPGVLEKVALGLSPPGRAGGIVDGHAPGLSGRALRAYVAAGISSDHECTTRAEAEEKLRLGMRVYIREGSAARNLEALLPAVSEANAHRFSFCTDDRHPCDLRDEGHIDHVVRKAVALGLAPATAIALASLHTAQHYRQAGIGAVAPGCFADLIVFDRLEDIRPRRVYFRGRLVAEDGAYLGPARHGRAAAPSRGRVTLPAGLSGSSFRVAASPGARAIRVIGMDPHQIVTAALEMPPRVEGGQYVADPARDLLKLAVIERHRGSGNIGLGFVHGFGFPRGALASTVGHDSHNLAVVGASDADMLAAARALEQAGGGQCVVRDGRVLALLPLPIAGLMSDRPAEEVIEQQRRLHEASRAIGCPHPDPFMPLSFLPLPVIPALKLTDLGLVDVRRFEVVPLEVG
ncbi:MAG: adenine deaminase [Phycisphaerales bacterium]